MSEMSRRNCGVQRALPCAAHDRQDRRNPGLGLRSAGLPLSESRAQRQRPHSDSVCVVRLACAVETAADESPVRPAPRPPHDHQEPLTQEVELIWRRAAHVPTCDRLRAASIRAGPREGTTGPQPCRSPAPRSASPVGSPGVSPGAVSVLAPASGSSNSRTMRIPSRAGVVKLADARDSKSRSLRGVWVRFPPPAPTSIQRVLTIN